MKGSGNDSATFTKTCLIGNEILQMQHFHVHSWGVQQAIVFQFFCLVIARGDCLSHLTCSTHKEASTCYTVSRFSSVSSSIYRGI